MFLYQTTSWSDKHTLMTPSAHLAAVMELFAQSEESLAHQSKKPADALVAEFFRARRYIGSKDRASIASLFYFIIRHKSSLAWFAHQAQHAASARVMVMLGTAFHQSLNVATVEELYNGQGYAPHPLTHGEQSLLKSALEKGLMYDGMPAHIRSNVPQWLYGLLSDAYGEECDALLNSLMEEAPVDIRVNTLKAAPKQVMHALKKQGIHHATPMQFAEQGLRLKRREPLFALQIFREGWFEVQDEGSQIVAALVAAQPKQKVIDFCAGAGGKTLAIAAAMQNAGRILAFDVNEARLEQCSKRLRRAGVHNVETKLLTSESDALIKRHKKSADWVLVDAPCTGTGTWRRSPDLKWRTTPKDVQELTDLQRRILESAARLVKDGGHLVYATCSLLPQENEQQIDTFLANHPDFSVKKVLLHEQPETNNIRLTPVTHGTDGFFSAVLHRQIVTTPSENDTSDKIL
jgi:16S rRNA (cytosine967-C5)-methyltransferase